MGICHVLDEFFIESIGLASLSKIYLLSKLNVLSINMGVDKIDPFLMVQYPNATVFCCFQVAFSVNLVEYFQDDYF